MQSAKLREISYNQSEYGETPFAEAEASETQMIDDFNQEQAPNIDVFLSRKRVSKHSRVSLSASKKGRKNSCQESTFDLIFKASTVQQEKGQVMMIEPPIYDCSSK